MLASSLNSICSAICTDACFSNFTDTIICSSIILLCLPPCIWYHLHYFVSHAFPPVYYQKQADNLCTTIKINTIFIIRFSDHHLQICIKQVHRWQFISIFPIKTILLENSCSMDNYWNCGFNYSMNTENTAMFHVTYICGSITCNNNGYENIFVSCNK